MLIAMTISGCHSDSAHDKSTAAKEPAAGSGTATNVANGDEIGVGGYPIVGTCDARDLDALKAAIKDKEGKAEARTACTEYEIVDEDLLALDKKICDAAKGTWSTGKCDRTTVTRGCLMITPFPDEDAPQDEPRAKPDHVYTIWFHDAPPPMDEYLCWKWLNPDGTEVPDAAGEEEGDGT